MKLHEKAQNLVWFVLLLVLQWWSPAPDDEGADTRFQRRRWSDGVTGEMTIGCIRVSVATVHLWWESFWTVDWVPFELRPLMSILVKAGAGWICKTVCTRNLILTALTAFSWIKPIRSSELLHFFFWNCFHPNLFRSLSPTSVKGIGCPNSQISAKSFLYQFRFLCFSLLSLSLTLILAGWDGSTE